MAHKNPLRQDEMTREQEQEAARRLAALLRQQRDQRNAADEQERRARAASAEGDRLMQERTRLVSILVQTVEDLPTGEQGHIRAMCNFVFGQILHLPLSDHLVIITDITNCLRMNDTAHHRENALRAYCARFEGANRRPGSAEGMPSGFLYFNSRTGQTSRPYEREIERIRQVEMDRLRTEPAPPIMVDLNEATRTALRQALRSGTSHMQIKATNQPEPPKPTGHRFSGKRKFKLEE